MSLRSALLALGLLVFVLATAQEVSQQVAVQTANDPVHGVHLVDGAGRSLYMSASDPKGASTCVDVCAETWLPFVTDGPVSAGQGVAPTLLDTFERSDGTHQITYFGIPLYHFASDSEPGEAAGQGSEGNWFLVSPFGAAIVPKVSEPATASTGNEEPTHMELAMVLGKGQEVFSTYCAVCHGARGAGGTGPTLVSNRIDDNRRVIRQVLFGGGHMPPFGGALDDDQIAAVLTFVRKSWGNDSSVISSEEVGTYR